MVSRMPSRVNVASGCRYSVRIRTGRPASLSRNASSLYASGLWLTSGSFMIPRTFKVDEAALDIRAQELHADAVADVDARIAANDASFNRRLQDPHPGALVGGAGHDALKH